MVKSTVDLPGVPKGTVGKIKVINGFTWRRYWVFFDNGEEVGQLDGGELVRPDHWDHYFEQKALEEERAAKAAEAAANGAAAEAAGGAAAADADPSDPLAAMRAMIPPALLERSEAARIRLLGK